MSRTLAIIGTAGRGPDLARLSGGYNRSMLTVAQVTCKLLNATVLVSGGSAWSDHLSVQLYLDDQVEDLILHLPCSWVETDMRFEATSQTSPGARLNESHSQFTAVTGSDSLSQISQAIAKGAEIHVNRGGFKARNTDVANDADAMLAFTFGDGPKVNGPGTLDTVTKFTSRRSHPDWPDQLKLMGSPYLPAYHFDLTTRKLYSI